MLEIWPVPVFADNYVWILQREGSNRVTAVDPGDGEPVIEALSRRELELTAVLITHHHQDHVGGLPELIRPFHPPVYGSAIDSIPGVDHPVAGGDRVSLPDLEIEFEVVALPGHTAGHIGFIGAGCAFVGDTLFAGGCGRVFEGTMAQMYESLTRLAELPPETMAYCAHEYTMANLRFALQVESENDALARRIDSVEVAREASQPTVPSSIGYELETNPFLRCAETSVQNAAESHTGQILGTPAEVFSALRVWKDGWSG